MAKAFAESVPEAVASDRATFVTIHLAQFNPLTGRIEVRRAECLAATLDYALSRAKDAVLQEESVHRA